MTSLEIAKGFCAACGLFDAELIAVDKQWEFLTDYRFVFTGYGVAAWMLERAHEKYPSVMQAWVTNEFYRTYSEIRLTVAEEQSIEAKD